MCIGAYAWNKFPEEGIILEMFRNRTIKPFHFYASHFMHQHFPEFILIRTGKEREGSKIAKVKIDNMDNFKELVYEPDFPFDDTPTDDDVNILYLGMADDIMSPLLLVPNFTNIII